MRRSAFLTSLILLAACRCFAQDLKAVNKQLNGKVMIIRDLYSGDKLIFDEHGALLKGNPPGPWTLAGEFHIDHVSLKDHAVRFEGQRAAVTFPKQTLERGLVGLGRASIDVEFSHETTPADVQPALNAAFLTATESLADYVPPYWQPLLKGTVKPLALGTRKRDKNAPQSTALQATLDQCYPDLAHADVMAVDEAKGVAAPKALTDPDPDMSEEAKNARYQGTVQFCAIVDETGSLKDVRVVTPLGFGLDDNTARVMNAWKFRPATKDGKPVRVVVMIETNFSFF